MKSKISVIVAVYHGDNFIVEPQERLFRQTKLPDEILITYSRSPGAVREPRFARCL